MKIIIRISRLDSPPYSLTNSLTFTWIYQESGSFFRCRRSAAPTMLLLLLLEAIKPVCPPSVVQRNGLVGRRSCWPGVGHLIGPLVAPSRSSSACLSTRPNISYACRTFPSVHSTAEYLGPPAAKELRGQKVDRRPRQCKKRALARTKRVETDRTT